MMTLDECIDYAEAQSEWMSKYAMIDIYKDKSEYYRQLAEWLKELKAYREQVMDKTNGDVIMAMFPNCQPCVGTEMVDTDIALFEREWWDAPYEKDYISKDILDKIRAEIAEYGSIMVAYAITEDTKTDKGIEKLVSDVLSETKRQVLDIIDKYKKESEG